MLDKLWNNDRLLVAAAVWSAATTHTALPTPVLELAAQTYRD